MWRIETLAKYHQIEYDSITHADRATTLVSSALTIGRLRETLWWWYFDDKIDGDLYKLWKDRLDYLVQLVMEKANELDGKTTLRTQAITGLIDAICALDPEDW